MTTSPVPNYMLQHGPWMGMKHIIALHDLPLNDQFSVNIVTKKKVIKISQNENAMKQWVTYSMGGLLYVLNPLQFWYTY